MVKRRRDTIVREQKKQVKKPVHEKQALVVDDVSEDYCFECKEGGDLIVCDYKGCLKAYHPVCIGQEEGTNDSLICEWHKCLICKKSPRYQCFCCKHAVCQSCFKEASFAIVRKSKGFCHNCLKLALLSEEGLDVDSDGEKVDFGDIESVEGLFKEYWDIVKEKEGLTLDDLHNADVQIQKGQNAKVKSHNKPESDSDEFVKPEDNKDSSSDDHDSEEEEAKPVIVTKIEKTKNPPKKKKGSSRIEYVGWASKSLMEFLSAIGVETSKKISQSEVTSLIIKYAQENKLFHPDKRKIIICDLSLYSLLKRKTVSTYKINDGIEAHFLDNVEQSEDEGYSSGYEENNASLPTKKQGWWRKAGSFQQHKGPPVEKFQQKEDILEESKKIETVGSFQPHKGSLMEKFRQKEAIFEEPKKIETVVKLVDSNFASIVPSNMKFVYLKRSLVESLSENCETFESKVMESFVKVKSEPYDHKCPYQLLPVTGIKKASGDDNKMVLLQVSNLSNYVPMRLLSNDDLSLEDCEALQQKIETGVIPKLTVVELEKKAKDLHEDITKHAITRELSTLKHRIDLANEKGRRAELFEYRRRRDLLQSEEEQSRLLNELPKVIAEQIEVKPDSQETGNNNDVGDIPSNDPCEVTENDNDVEDKIPA